MPHPICLDYISAMAHCQVGECVCISATEQNKPPEQNVRTKSQTVLIRIYYGNNVDVNLPTPIDLSRKQMCRKTATFEAIGLGVHKALDAITWQLTQNRSNHYSADNTAAFAKRSQTSTNFNYTQSRIA